MGDISLMRTTTGVVDRIEPDGFVFVHEIGSLKLGFLANTTPVAGNACLKPGTKLTLEVEDKGNVMVVVSAAPSLGG